MTCLLADIECIIFDIDGTLTDGRINLSDEGVEIKSFCAKDAPPISAALKLGIKIVFLTGRDSHAARLRAKELSVHFLLKRDYDPALLVEWLKNKGIQPQHTAYIGDDWNDIPYGLLFGLFVTPSDATDETTEAADIILRTPGGHGVAREIICRILREKGLLQEALSRYTATTVEN